MMAASYTLCRMEEHVMAPNPGFPLVLDVKGFSVLVIGGDEEAADKSQRLLESGARVTVISPTLHETLKLLAASAKVIHRGRHFRETDLEHTILVLNTIRGDREFAKMLLAKPGSAPVLTITAGHYLRQALMITLLNPKAILFYMAFFPLFVDPARQQGLVTYGFMAATIAVITFLYGLTSVLLTYFLAERIRANPMVTRVLEKVAGLFLVGFGIKLAISR